MYVNQIARLVENGSKWYCKLLEEYTLVQKQVKHRISEGMRKNRRHINDNLLRACYMPTYLPTAAI